MLIKTLPLTPEEEEQYEVIGLVTSQATRGLGFWTSICLAFANFFGTRCNHYAWKLEKAKIEVVDDMADEAREQGADAIVGVNLVISGLSVLGSGTAVKKKRKPKQEEENKKFCAFCGMKIDKDSVFCPHCGQKCADYFDIE